MAEEKQGHVKYIRVRQADGSFTDAMLIAVSPYNVDFEDGTNLVEKLEEKAEKRYYGDTSINVGRIPGTDTGTNSIAVGENVTAKGNQSASSILNICTNDVEIQVPVKATPPSARIIPDSKNIDL